MNNYERIKSMTVDEMAKYLVKSRCNSCIYNEKPDICNNCSKGIKQWLLSEVTNEI